MKQQLQQLTTQTSSWARLVFDVFKGEPAQSAAVRLLINTKRQDRISPILASLHWLPVSFKMYCKILLITSKALHGLAPSYTAELLLPYEPVTSFKSILKQVF